MVSGEVLSTGRKVDLDEVQFELRASRLGTALSLILPEIHRFNNHRQHQQPTSDAGAIKSGQYIR